MYWVFKKKYQSNKNYKIAMKMLNVMTNSFYAHNTKHPNPNYAI